MDNPTFLDTRGDGDETQIAWVENVSVCYDVGVHGDADNIPGC